MKLSPSVVLDESVAMLEGRALELPAALVVGNGSITKLECTVIVNEPAALLGGGGLELEVVVTLGG